MKTKYSKPAKVAHELCTNERTLANWRCQRKGPPFVKVGSSVLYPDDELEKWLSERLVDTVAESTKICSRDKTTTYSFTECADSEIHDGIASRVTERDEGGA